MALDRRIATNDECRLRQIRFVGHLLHLGCGQLARVFEDSELVALKRSRGEDIAQAIREFETPWMGGTLEISLKLTHSLSGSIL